MVGGDGGVRSGVSRGGFGKVSSVMRFFFFQAEDGIRDLTVTGVQTCALPISQIDVAKFASNPTYNNLSSLLGHPVLILYVADLRTQTSGTESGVRLTNGIILPSAGLTVATLNPLYVLGHYNAPDTTPGSTNTGKPASLVAAAITILSGP